MTRVSDSTARRGAGRVAAAFLGGILAIMSAGCSSNTAATGGEPPAATAALAPPQVPTTKPVTFAPVIGAPARVATRLNELMVAQAQQKQVPVVPPKDAEYTIRGYLVAAADPKGTKLSYIWDVSDKANKRKRIQGEELIEGKKGGDPWAAVDDAAMQRVAVKAVDEIADWLPKIAPAPAPAAVAAAPAQEAAPASGGGISSLLGGIFSSSSTTNTAVASAAPEPASAPSASAQPVQVASISNDTPVSQRASSSRSASATDGSVLAAQTPAEPARQQVAAANALAVVPTVSGAPGDGGQSLTAAMRKYLQSAGVKLTDSPGGGNVYTVRGTVEMGGAVNGQQPITIQWTVVDPNGKPLDKAVVQRNKVAQGSLDGPWGQIADMAAGEAAKSIAKLLTKPTG